MSCILFALVAAAAMQIADARTAPAPDPTPQPDMMSPDGCIVFREFAATVPEISSAFNGECFAQGTIPRILAAAEETRLTTFVSNNGAFDKLTDAECDLLATDVDVALSSVVRGEFAAADLEDGQELQSLGGVVLKVAVNEDGTITLTAGEGGTTATVVTPDAGVTCSGTVHIIDTQLIPGPALDALAPPPPEATKADEDCIEFRAFAATVPQVSRAFNGECFAGATIPRIQAAAAEGRITTFVSNNDAFGKLSEAECDLLATDVDVALSTVVRGDFAVEDLEKGQRLKSLGGAVLIVGAATDGTTTLTAGEGGTTARIVVGDAAVTCSGTVHIIDTQLVPGPALAALSPPPPPLPPAAKPARKTSGGPRRRKTNVRFGVRVYRGSSNGGRVRAKVSVSARRKRTFRSHFFGR